MISRRLGTAARIVLTFVGLCAVPLGILLVYSFQSFYSIASEVTQKQAGTSLQQLINTIEFQKKQSAISFVAEIQNTVFQDTIESLYRTTDDALRYSLELRLDSLIQGAFSFFLDNVRSMVVVLDDGHRYVFRRDLFTSPESVNEWKTRIQAKAGSNRVAIEGIEASRAIVSEDLVTFTILPTPGLGFGSGHIAMVVLALYPGVFTDLTLAAKGTGSELVVLDKDDRVLLNTLSQHTLLTDLRRGPMIGDIRSAAPGTPFTLPATDEREGFLVLSYPNADSWLYLTFIPLSLFARDLSALFGIQAAVVLIVFLLSAAAFLFTTRRILRPLSLLHHHMRGTSGVSMEPYTGPVGSVETRQLTVSYNRLLRRLKKNIQEIRKHEEEKKEAELEVLLAQINPHFLINTINTIRITAKMNDQPIIEKMLQDLSTILGANYRTNGDFNTIQNEIDLLKIYVNIMKFRYGDVFDLFVEAPKTLMRNYLLRFVLQPFVENAILHGMVRKSIQKRGSIHVALAETDEGLEITISDDGSGFDTGAGIAGHATGSSYHMGLGIDNVNNRIRLCHGAGYGASIVSAPGKGTTVSVRLPLIERAGN